MNNIFSNKKFLIGLLVLLTGIVYLNSLKVPFLLDDFKKIVENPDIRRIENIPSKLIYPYGQHQVFERNDPSRPLVYLTFTLNYFLSRLNPVSYHVFNLTLHILNVILVFFLSEKILLLFLEEDIPLPGFFTALFFAVHPVNVTSVTYIFSRSGLLEAFFYLSAVLSFIKAFQNDRKYYALSLLCFALALASRQSAVTLPAVILLVDYMLPVVPGVKKPAGKIYYHLGFWALLAVYLAGRYFFFRGLGDLEAIVPWTRKEYLAVQPYMFIKYLQFLVFPAGLCIDHAIAHMNFLNVKILLSLAAIAIALSALLWFYLKKSRTAGLLAFCALWFIIILSPTSSFFPTTSALVENRMYLSGIGFYIALVYSCFIVFNKITAKAGRTSPFAVIILCSCAIVFSVITLKRNTLFQNPLELWKKAEAMYPWNASAHNRLANIYRKNGDTQKAINEFLISIKLNPAFAVETYSNIAVIDLDRGDYGGALDMLSKTLELDPKYAPAYNNLGVLLQKQGKIDEAVKYFRKALGADPGYLEAKTNIINLLLMQEKNSLALQEINDMLKSNPESAQGHASLGIYCLNVKDYAKASEELQKALDLNPENAVACDNLGIICMETGKFDKAAREFRRAIEIDPGLADAYTNLGSIYVQEELFKEGYDQLQKALKLAPENYKVHYGFGVLYYNMNEYDKAVYAFEKTLVLNPRFANAYNNLGILFLKMSGDYAGAVKAFKKAAELEPGSTSALYNLAYVYSSQKKYTQALQAYERILKLTPSDETVVNKIKLIRGKARGS